MSLTHFGAVKYIIFYQTDTRLRTVLPTILGRIHVGFLELTQWVATFKNKERKKKNRVNPRRNH